MSFKAEQLSAYLDASSLSEDAKQYIVDAAREPSRNVGESGFRCVVGAFQSRKMGHSVSIESRGGEYAFAIALEYDPHVVAFYDQPPLVDCRRTDRRGRASLRAYHPDFLVLKDTDVEVVQVKSADKLQSHLDSYPQDWQLVDGRPCDLPADAAFSLIGLPHRVVSIDELPRIRSANLRLLLQVRDDDTPIDERLESSILAAAAARAITSISELAEKAGSEDLTPILALIDEGVLFADIDNCLLTAPESCWVCRNPLVLEEFVQSQKARDLLPGSQQDDSVGLGFVPPLSQAKRALKILDDLKDNPGSRNSRRMRRAIKEAGERGESAFQAVTPKNYKSGNRSSKRPPQVLAFAEDVIRSQWATPKQSSKVTTFGTYLLEAKEWHPSLAPVSYPTFSKITRDIRILCAKGRGGRRAENSVAAPSDVSDRIIRARRPFELASCDHCLAKIFAVVFRTDQWIYVQRPWLTALIDCSTGKSLASWLSFKQPSRISCAMVLRDCLRRHGRLPEGIITDRGSEFGSVYFSSLLAHCVIDSFRRPTSDCRYGSEAERYFGLFKTHWLDARPGNITHYKNARAVSGSHSPSAFAQIELHHLIEELASFDQWLSGKRPTSELASANERMALGLRQFPFSGRKVPFDQSFLIASAVDAREIRLDPARGIKQGSSWYWGPALRDDRLRRKDIEVRIEPEDYTRIYVRANDRWDICQSTEAPIFSLKSHSAKLAESVIMHDCAAASDLADKDAKIDLARRLKQADEALRSDSPPADSQRVEESDAAGDIFDHAQSCELEILDHSEWGSS
jgi:putative transposase